MQSARKLGGSNFLEFVFPLFLVSSFISGCLSWDFLEKNLLLLSILSALLFYMREKKMPRIQWSSLNVTALLVVCYVLISSAFSYTALLRHQGLHTYDFDFGYYCQLFWNFANGRGPMQLVENVRNGSALADHQSFTIYPFALFFKTTIGPELLLVSQSFLLFLPALVFTRWIALWKKTNHAPIWAFLFFFLWVRSPAIVNNTVWDWHETSLSLNFLCLWAWAFLEKRVLLMTAAALLAGLTKEHLFILLIPGTIGFCLWHFTQKERPKFLWVSLLSTFSFVFLFLIDQFYFSDFDYSAFAYPALGDSQGEIIQNIFFRPDLWVGALFLPERTLFFRELFASSGGAAFFSPLSLAWIPIYAFHCISSIRAHYQLWAHYSLEVFPIMALSTVQFWRTVISKYARFEWPLMLITAALIVNGHGKSAIESIKELKTDAVRNQSELKKMNTHLNEMNHHCGDNLTGVAGRMIFSHVYHYGTTYPLQTSLRMRKKLGFEDRFISSKNVQQKYTGCRFIVAPKNEAESFLKDFPQNATKRMVFDIEDFGFKREYVLYQL